MKRSEEIPIRSTYAVIAFSVTSTSNFSCVINGYLLTYSMEQKPSWESNRF